MDKRISEFKATIIIETIKKLDVSSSKKKEIIKEMLDKMKSGELKV